MVNGQAHGPRAATSVCQLYLREFNDGAVLTLDPWRAKAFPPIQDLMVDRSAFDRLIAAGGYCSTGTGQAPDGNALPVGIGFDLALTVASHNYSNFFFDIK